MSNNQENNGKSANVGNSSHQRGTGKKGKKGGSSSEMEYINREHNEPLGSNLNDHETNALGVYGPCVDELRVMLKNEWLHHAYIFLRFVPFNAVLCMFCFVLF